MDEQQWQEFHDTVLERVGNELERARKVAEAMDPIDAKFTASIEIDGDAIYKTGTRVNVPIFVDDESEDDPQ